MFSESAVSQDLFVFVCWHSMVAAPKFKAGLILQITSGEIDILVILSLIGVWEAHKGYFRGYEHPLV